MQHWLGSKQQERDEENAGSDQERHDPAEDAAGRHDQQDRARQGPRDAHRHPPADRRTLAGDAGAARLAELSPLPAIATEFVTFAANGGMPTASSADTRPGW
jgi:hypothetical protein